MRTTTGNAEAEEALGGNLDYLEHGASYVGISDSEVQLLQTLSEPAIIPTTTREFANLRHLGLIFLEDQSGRVRLTPLGKAWMKTQARWGTHSL